jgi:microcystin-dependent protein
MFNINIKKIIEVVLLGILIYLIYKYFYENENFADIVQGDTLGDIQVNKLQVNGNIDIFPPGIIAAWNGASPPTGWALCDGNNGTPNLTGKFILGFGQGDGLTNRNLGEQGGEVEHVLTVNELPLHNHAYVSGNNWVTIMNDISGAGKSRNTSNSNLGEGNRMGETGGDQPHNNMHPYYKLAFIMKLPN